MASRAQALTITYTAWDISTNGPKTGDSANHTLRWIKDGASAAPANTPTQVDATNAPGEYNLTLTDAECTAWFGKLAGKSSTANVVILPVAVNFENLPTANPGAISGLPVNKSTLVGGVAVQENVVLHETALNGIDSTVPTGAPANFRERMDMVYRRWFKKHAKNNTTKVITHYADDNTTAIVSQTYTDDGNGNENVNAAT